MPEEEHAVRQAQSGDALLEELALRTFARAEELHAGEPVPQEGRRLHQRAMPLDRPEVPDDGHGHVVRSEGQRRLQGLRGEPIEMRQVDPVAHYHHALGPAPLVPDAHLAHRVRVDDDQIGMARVPFLGLAVPLAESLAQMAEVDPADDHLRPGQPPGREGEEVGVEIGGVDDAHPVLAHQRRHPGDLLERVRPQHRSLEREEDRLVAEGAHLLEHRPRQLQAPHQRAEAGRVQPQPLHELPLRAADPEPVDEMQDRNVHRFRNLGKRGRRFQWLAATCAPRIRERARPSRAPNLPRFL